MIERVLIKDYLSLRDIDINFCDNLVAFTGSSGAGKSVFMNALLALFGLKEAEARLVEANVDLPLPRLNEFGIEEEDINILRFTKEKKARYFINSQALSKKNMSQICKGFIRYLSLRNDDEFSSENLIFLLDKFIGKSDKSHTQNIEEYRKNYKKFLSIRQELKQIIDEEKKVDELKEFARYEIKLIDEVDPKIGEDKKLMELKKSLSKKEKILDAIREANRIFEFEHLVNEMLNLCERDSSFFDECMNELRSLMDDESSKLDELEDLDIEQMLERIEQISKLKNRFGEIEDVLKYREKKLIQLQKYENISFQKDALQKDFEKVEKIVKDLGLQISKKRGENLHVLENKINDYLKKLYLNGCKIDQENIEFDENGMDKLEIKLDNVNLNKISSGELNRIRLAFIATKNEIQSVAQRGILILDEVDANLSGKEAMSVARVLKQISKSYQVLVISHQPQLPSLADEHFVVEKNDGVSTIKKLDEKQRINELARMISGEKINQEALNFATKLLQNTQKENV